MARSKTPAPVDTLDSGNPQAISSAGAALALVSEQALAIQQTFGLTSVDPVVLKHQINDLIHATGRALFEIGARLYALKVVLPSEEWRQAADELGLSPRAASRMMSAALKCVDANGEGRARLMALPQAKVLELVTLDESQLDELERSGQIGQLSLDFDEIDRLSAHELKARLRKIEQSNAAKDRVLAGKDRELNKLREQLEAVASDGDQRAAELVGLVRDATTAAEQALIALSSAAATALQEGEQEHVATAARTSVEYCAQLLADLIKRHGVAVQFEEMVEPSWMAPLPEKKPRKAA